MNHSLYAIPFLGLIQCHFIDFFCSLPYAHSMGAADNGPELGGEQRPHTSVGAKPSGVQEVTVPTTLPLILESGNSLTELVKRTATTHGPDQSLDQGPTLLGNTTPPQSSE